MIVKGSEWRKWDLHVHTKGTNKNDQYSCSCFDDFCKEMFSKAIENNISAIGITDYFSIDNYKKVIDYQNKNNKFVVKTENNEYVFDKVVFAAGGKAYPQLGTDGGVLEVLRQHDYLIETL